MTFMYRWSYEIDCLGNELIYIGNSSDEIWTTKEGKRIRVGDMTDDHIRNCYAMVMKTRHEDWQLVFKAELDKRKITI